MATLSERVRKFAAVSLRAKPDFLIIGAQKAGTTSLHSYLAQHPSLTPAWGRKELQYFNFYYDRHSPEWYLSHFPYKFQRKNTLLFEATPDYLMHDVVPERIRNELGPTKLIAILREPTGRAYSAWRMWHHFAESKPHLAFKADNRSFSEAIAQELEDPQMQQHRHFHYVAAGRYAEQLEAYLKYFDRCEMLILNYAEMERDLGQFLRRICRFLAVEEFDEHLIADMAKERLWVTPKIEMTKEALQTLDRLRIYYAPRNERLFEMLGERWDW